MISVIKLSNGETLIADITYKDDTKLTVSEPLKLDFIQHFGGPAMITTFWVPFEKEKISVDISMQHVIMSNEVPKETQEFYYKSLVNVRGEMEPETEETMKERVKQAMKKIYSSNTFPHTVH
ncbi:MAG: hypothetical protein CMO44_07045 [Verrucomicrobiales bacterium]|jgi:hypothetical protein|nr:hypothetical protein [Verrucomicrobiales bacterium]